MERTDAPQIAAVIDHEAHMRTVDGEVPASAGEAKGVMPLREGSGLKCQRDQPAHAHNFAIEVGFDGKGRAVQRS